MPAVYNYDSSLLVICLPSAKHAVQGHDAALGHRHSILFDLEYDQLLTISVCDAISHQLTEQQLQA